MFWMEDVRPSIFITFKAFAFTAAWAAAAMATLVAIREAAAADDDDDDLELLRDLSLLLLLLLPPPEEEDDPDFDEGLIVEFPELDNDPDELDF